MPLCIVLMSSFNIVVRLGKLAVIAGLLRLTTLLAKVLGQVHAKSETDREAVLKIVLCCPR